MTIAIPVWLMWALGIVGGVMAVFLIGVFLGLAFVGAACAKALAGGLRW